MTNEQGIMSAIAIPAKLLGEQIEQSWPPRITSDHLRQRARCYRLAAAIADVPRDVATFGALAMMFDRIARDFDRAGADDRSRSALNRSTVLADF